MPNRVIRESLLESERYWSVTMEAQLLFLHLLLLADDLGCVSVAYTFVRRRCFDSNPTVEKVSRLLGEIADADLVRLYDHDSGKYAFIPRFRQRLQRMTLRHPEPPMSILNGDDDAIEKFKKINDKTKNPTVGQQMANRWPTDGQPPEVEVEVKRRSSKERAGAPSAEKTRGTRLPPDWDPSEEDLRFMAAQRPDLDRSITIERFRDYWSAVPGARGRKVSWSATWRNWVRSETRRESKDKGSADWMFT